MWINRVLLFVVIVGIALIAVIFHEQLVTIKSTQKETRIENTRTNQFLLLTISWLTQRQKMLLYMRDIIIKEWQRAGAEQDYNKAYVKADAILKECERYPRIDPFSMLSVQRNESSFLDTVTSSAGARGSWQFMTSTAMLLCEATGILFNDRVYTDPVISTRLAGKYFEILFAAYPESCDLARFADYNGGPTQAYYYLYNKSKLSEETRTFVNNVYNTREEYRKGFPGYNPEYSLK